MLLEHTREMVREALSRQCMIGEIILESERRLARGVEAPALLAVLAEQERLAGRYPGQGEIWRKLMATTRTRLRHLGVGG